jgi:hypothetical protein
MGCTVHLSARSHRSSDAKPEWDTLYFESGFGSKFKATKLGPVVGLRGDRPHPLTRRTLTHREGRRYGWSLRKRVRRPARFMSSEPPDAPFGLQTATPYPQNCWKVDHNTSQRVALRAAATGLRLGPQFHPLTGSIQLSAAPSIFMTNRTFSGKVSLWRGRRPWP